ncbi:uncharacterized protein BO97DRAFT_410220 [Aspergillus homomorphus CBS 101889]|uniref:Uncharacterized protein n=1 Tax=Aspergillus homomorphus (strain CBS 101889) TaxID=1450537 RepID=A0A395IC10_ASPHC|nr:hypothetical protein BO97DRAFT_410220 [Aspergillus homomorphus CBS 101889]RAL16683.1 hypothetical protein BO97DRAFT_410220 [Aspergillus homomorphus CBS 101889]
MDVTSASTSPAPFVFGGRCCPLIDPDERNLAIQLFEETTVHFEDIRAADSGHKTVSLIKLMEREVCEENAWKLTDAKRLAHHNLTIFIPHVIHLFGVDIDRPKNPPTQLHELHRRFGNFEIGF